MPIEFFGRKLKQIQKVYPSKELLAIYETVKHFKNMFMGRKFTILTDLKALTYHFKLENQNEITSRWLVSLQQLDYQLEYIEVEINHADYV